MQGIEWQGDASAEGRAFTDDDGAAWHVRRFAPTIDTLLSDAHRHGWLTFERADGERRRLVPAPPDWSALDDAGLRAALAASRPVAREDVMREILQRRALHPLT